MVSKFYKWINKVKTKDNIITAFLNLLYKISKEWIQTIINVIFPIIASLLYNDKLYFFAIIIVIIISNIWFSIVNGYKSFDFNNRHYNNNILKDILTTIAAIDDYINKKNAGKGIFEYASNLVSSELYDRLKEITGSEVRISVIQQFRDKNNNRKCIMLSRKSQKHTSCSYKIKPVVCNKNEYYYMKILLENDDVNIFFTDKLEVDKHFCRRSQKKITTYINT